MKTIYFYLLVLVNVALFAQKTESPYLKVLTKGATIPLKETNADVQITGTIAYVHITQVYHNTSNIPIEAKYVFPLSTQSAVHKMDMTIGDRTIHAKIFEKEKAQKVYDKALKSGKRASKLDQERPNVFQISVGNIMPDDLITIDIHYTEMLVPITGEYQFVFPGVVGPRFVGESKSETKAFNLPYSKKGIADTFKYTINVTLNAGVAIQKVYSNTHKVNINYPNSNIAEISLSDDNKNPSNSDFILKYNLRHNQIQTGLLLYKGEKENFFAYLMEPPATVKNSQIPPREYVFILDVSGSMTGYPLDISKKLLKNLLSDLRKEDSFNILLFAGGSSIFNETPVKATNSNLESAMHFLSGNFGGGGTRLLNALQTAYALPRVNRNNSRSMVIVTDGYVSVEKEAFSIIKNNLNQANVFTFGIGSSVNRHLIEGMAKVSNSQSFIATSENDAYEMAKQFKKYIDTPLLTQINFKANGFDIYDVEPSSISDVFSSRPIIVFGKWKGNPKGELIVTGKTGNGNFKKTFKVSDAILSKNNKALKYLWARKKIELLDDYNFATPTSKKDVINLSLKYNLLTKYTSFVAVDEEVVNKNGNSKTVKQILPMPKNVNNSAVGAEASVKGKTFITNKYQVIIASNNFSKSEKRKVKIWLKANYSKLIKNLLKKHQSIRMTLNEFGKIIKIEVLKNKKWTINKSLIAEFINNSSNTIKINKPIEMIIK